MTTSLKDATISKVAAAADAVIAADNEMRTRTPLPMKPRTEYHVCEGRSRFALEAHVAIYLNQGWVLQGGVSVCLSGGSPLAVEQYYQAVSRVIS